MTKEKVKEEIENHKLNNKKIVFTNGCFDILHIGHLRYLEMAKNFGDILVVGINSDSSVKKLKGENRPICNEEERKELIQGLKPVDYTIIFSEQTPIKLLDFVKPHVHVKGGDYKVDDLPEKDIVEKNGGRVEIVKFVDGKSTTNIVEKIKENI